MSDKTTSSNSITFKISVQYSDILELVKTKHKKTRILFKNGDVLTFENGIGKRIFKNLMRNFPGEHIE